MIRLMFIFSLLLPVQLQVYSQTGSATLGGSDSGRTSSTSSNQKAKELTDELLAHGHRQVEAMLSDRIRMAAYPSDQGTKLVKKSDPFYRFCVRKFAGEDVGSPIFWDKTLPKSSSAEHDPASPDSIGAIRIRPKINGQLSDRLNGRRKDFELLWYEAIYELNNSAAAIHFNSLQREVEKGNVDKEAYIRQMAKIEFKAIQSTRKFFEEHWVPWAIKVKLRPTFQADLIGWQTKYESFEKWIALYTDKNSYPWVPYSAYHDSIVAYAKKYGVYRSPVNNALPFWRAVQRQIDAANK